MRLETDADKYEWMGEKWWYMNCAAGICADALTDEGAGRNERVWAGQE